MKGGNDSLFSSLAINPTKPTIHWLLLTELICLHSCPENTHQCFIGRHSSSWTHCSLFWSNHTPSRCPRYSPEHQMCVNPLLKIDPNKRNINCRSGNVNVWGKSNYVHERNLLICFYLFPSNFVKSPCWCTSSSSRWQVWHVKVLIEQHECDTGVHGTELAGTQCNQRQSSTSVK